MDRKAKVKTMKNIPCPEGHTNTYTYNSPKHGLLLMCNNCEDGYELVYGEANA